jgi:hypothetical protein
VGRRGILRTRGFALVLVRDCGVAAQRVTQNLA